MKDRYGGRETRYEGLTRVPSESEMMLPSRFRPAFFFFILRHKKKASIASTIVAPAPAAPAAAFTLECEELEELALDTWEGIGMELDSETITVNVGFGE